MNNPRPAVSSLQVFSWVLALALAGWSALVLPDVLKATLASGWSLGGQLLAAQAARAAFGLLAFGAVPGCLCCLLLLAASREQDSTARQVAIGVGLLAILPPLAWPLAAGTAQFLGTTGPAPAALAPWALGLGLGLGAGLVWLRYGVSGHERFRAALVKASSLERNQRTDVREIDRFLPAEIGAFDPLKYVDEARGYLVGLDENRKPIFIPADDWKLSHILLSGRTRSGKGVAAQILLSQAIARGEFVVVLDPKNDNWMPHVFYAAAKRAGQPYHFLDLRPGRPPQINMFAGCDEETAENMLIAAFSLAEKGEAADFYRLSDRKAAREAARFIAGGKTAAETLKALGRAWAEAAPGFHAALEEMADLPAVNAVAGLDIEALAKTGGCLYVVGDMSNTRVIRMQRMMLVRLMMLAKSGRPKKLITVFADEFKVHISRPFTMSLGAAAGWGLHCILAFQSLQDPADVPADLDRDSVRGAVMENCGIQLSYRIKDPETAEWLAASTGTILVDDEMRTVDRNLALTETVSDERRIRMAERYLIDVNMLLSLPKGCGVLSGATKLPAFCYTSHALAARCDEAITPHAAMATAAPPPLPAKVIPAAAPPVAPAPGGAVLMQPVQAARCAPAARHSLPSDDEDFV